MAAGGKGFWTVFAGSLAILMIFGAVSAWSVHSAGMFELDIHERGPGGADISGIRIPAVFGHLALAFIPMSAFDFCEDDEFVRHGALVQEACEQLRDAPDFVLVEVISQDEHVLVRKQHNALIIDVESEDEEVHLSVPLGIARAFARKMERANRDGS